MNGRSGFLYFFPVIMFLIGGVLPYMLLSSYQYETEWSDKTQSIMYISMCVITANFFNIIGNRINKLKVWATDTVSGISFILFAFSFIISISVNVFLIIPLPSLILFIISIFISVVGCILFFKTAIKKDS